MFDYIKKADVLAKLDDEIDFCRRLKTANFELVMGAKNSEMQNPHLRHYEEYRHRLRECIEIRKIVEAM